MAQTRAGPQEPLSAQASVGQEMHVGFHVEPDLIDLAEEVSEELGDELADRFPGCRWTVGVEQAEPKDPSQGRREFVRDVRRYSLDRGWDLAVCLTRLPLRSNRRPVVFHAHATEGVGLISVPALGPFRQERRAREAVLDLIDGLMSADAGAAAGDGDRVSEQGPSVSPKMADQEGTVRFSSAVVRGNLRLLLGMVRSNHPWRIAARLSRAVVAALGTAAYILASASVWQLAASLTWPRLLGLTLFTLAAAAVILIVAHDLWEQSSRPEDRERIVLFNAATTLTIAIGVITCYAALFALAVLAALALIPSHFLASQIQQSVSLADYLHLGWFAATLATIAGALGSLTESDLSVREAAYGYHPDAAADSAPADEDLGGRAR
jgi:uncharacterized membrane protein